MNKSFWVVTAFFNASGFQVPVQNYLVFSRRLVEQGVNLLTVELAFGDTPFVLPVLRHTHRLRGQSILWQKERLINYALSLLPAECDKVAWVDADILWPDATFVSRTCALLDQGCDVVQLFEGAFRLYPGQTAWVETNPEGFPLWWEPGTAFHLVNGWCFEHTCMGFAWAARREWLEKVRLYDRAILGSGDYILLGALFDRVQGWNHPPLDDDIALWRAAVQQTRPRVGYVAGTICHLFHGNLSERGYLSRHQILIDHDYHPLRDIFEIDHVWEWATWKLPLHEAVRHYFLDREEDAAREDSTTSRHIPSNIT